MPVSGGAAPGRVVRLPSNSSGDSAKKTVVKIPASARSEPEKQPPAVSNKGPRISWREDKYHVVLGKPKNLYGTKPQVATVVPEKRPVVKAEVKVVNSAGGSQEVPIQQAAPSSGITKSKVVLGGQGPKTPQTGPTEKKVVTIPKHVISPQLKPEDPPKAPRVAWPDQKYKITPGKPKDLYGRLNERKSEQAAIDAGKVVEKDGVKIVKGKPRNLYQKGKSVSAPEPIHDRLSVDGGISTKDLKSSRGGLSARPSSGTKEGGRSIKDRLGENSAKNANQVKRKFSDGQQKRKRSDGDGNSSAGFSSVDVPLEALIVGNNKKKRRSFG